MNITFSELTMTYKNKLIISLVMWNETIRQFVNAVCKMMFENNQQLNFTEITEKCLTLPPMKSFGAKTKALSLQP